MAKAPLVHASMINPFFKVIYSRSFPLATLNQNPGQLGLLSIFIHVTEHDRMLIA